MNVAYHRSDPAGYLLKKKRRTRFRGLLVHGSSAKTCFGYDKHVVRVVTTLQINVVAALRARVC